MEDNRIKNGTKAAAGGFLVVSIVAISLCMRGAITAVGPQVATITEDLSVSSSVMGLITTLPLLAFGLFSPFVGKINEKLGVVRLILFALIAMLAGIVIRCADGVAGLFVGTILMGLGIAVGNVMIPSMIKKWFPDRVSQMTSVYTTAMGTFAAVGAGSSIPISMQLGWGWRGALGIWGIVSAAALLLWIVQIKLGVPADTSSAAAAGSGAKTEKRRSVWTSKTAWYITMFMGFQSLLFYSTSSWMPTIVQDHGVSPEGASLLALIFQAMGIFANMATAVIYTKTKRQDLLGAAIGIVFLVGLSSLFLFEDSFLIIAVLLACAGVASGGSLSWILTTIGVVGSDAAETAELSGMAQSIGYLLAAVGPLLSGFLYDVTGGWTTTICFYLAGGAALAVMGVMVGRRKSLF